LKYSISDLCKLVDGEFSSYHNESHIEHVAYDTRLPIYGEQSIFIALKTARADGHKYVERAYDKGCRSFLVSQPVKLPEGINVVMVQNTMEALHQLASYHRNHYTGKVLGITGSWGKTTVKEWLYELAKGSFNIIKSPKSFNSQLGVALSLLNLDNNFDVAIIEAGISEPGEMVKLERMIKPDIGLITAIAEPHQANFLNDEEKLNEKLKLFKDCTSILYCSDHELIDKTIRRDFGNKRLITWGKDGDLKVKHSSNSSTELSYGEQSIRVLRQFDSSYHFDNLMHGVLAALYLGVPAAEVEQSATLLKPLTMRLEMKSGQYGITLVNDSYTADFHSLDIALNYLEKVGGNQIRMLVVSEFDQQNITEAEFDKKLSKYLSIHGLSKVAFIGNYQLPETSKSLRSGFSQYANVNEFLVKRSPEEFANYAILIKGARRFGLEKIINSFQAQSHRTTLELNMSALASNYAWFKSQLKPGTKVMVMLKALSYGAGTFEIARLLQNLSCDYLAVAYIDEGVALRKHGINIPIMVLNPDEEGFIKLFDYHLEPEVYSMEMFHKLVAFSQNHIGDKKMPIHINIDTGMRRLGFTPEEINEVVTEIVKYQNLLSVKSVFTHMAAADEPKHAEFTHQQLSWLNQSVEHMRSQIAHHFLVHAGNTAATISYPDAHLDMVRLGIGFYGVNTTEQNASLELAFRLTTRISQIKAIKAGESVGYSRAWMATEDCTIATIPIGYADGIPRKLGNGKGHVFINGKAAPFVGSICMDMSMVLLDDNSAKEGDLVVIFENNRQLLELSRQLDTIPYEVLAGISQRVKRIYLED